MILAIDFSNTLEDHINLTKGQRFGPPMEGAKEAMEFLMGAGHTLIIHSVIADTPLGTKALEEWLRFYKVPYDFITAVKPNAEVFLDDKAIRFEDWGSAVGAIIDIDGPDSRSLKRPSLDSWE